MDSLPAELKLQIVSYLDGDAPSVQNFTGEPSVENWAHCKHQPLKSLSLVSRKWRIAVFPSLFRNIRLNLDSMGPPLLISDDPLYSLRLEGFSAFPPTPVLQNRITSLFVYATATNEWVTQIDSLVDFWGAILPLMPHLQRIVILANPEAIGNLIDIHIVLHDSWAFDMPLQAIMLEQAPGSEYDTFMDLPDDRRFPRTMCRNGVLDPRKWTNISINEGSSLKAYSTYEYFHKTPPSISRGLKEYFRVTPLFQTLTHITFVAIFPLPDAVERFVARFAKLRLVVQSLTVQLAPLYASRLLEDPERVGTAQLSDCWSELGESYRSLGEEIPQQAARKGSRLRLFRCLDWGLYEGFQEELSLSLGGPLAIYGWETAGDGIWRRPVEADSETGSASDGTDAGFDISDWEDEAMDAFGDH
ncbi:hypothetical protein EV356DRAFT_528497 [Viridothelium virens]|uniref:F-box domain-containing protein n=1 Tax=Viridothelium virens TaxID=1048519 RepID=A0A6A6HP16_VIRVR|nr:hypothetical protein EV356DRAFT_528497 [Viridothelium virens]